MNRWCILQHIFLAFVACVARVHAIDIDQICPRMLNRVLDGCGPIGNRSSTEYKEVSHANDIEKCVFQCCLQKSECNVAFMSNGRCFHVRCVSDEQCLPLKRSGMADKWKMVLVKPISADSSWISILKEKGVDAQYSPSDIPAYDSDESYSLLRERIYNQLKQNSQVPEESVYGMPRYMDDAQQNDEEMFGEESRVSASQAIDCVANRGACGPNEVCIPFRSTQMGICHCRAGYGRDEVGKCVLDAKDEVEDKYRMLKKLQPSEPIGGGGGGVGKSGGDADDTAVKHLSVSVVPKTVQLPVNEASLSAFPVPDEQASGVAYNYSWSLIGQPKGAINGTMSDKTKNEIQLSNLSEGVYQFKVVVLGRGWAGEAFANVTVQPQKRVNRPPVVIINPATQIIKEPTSTAILDGSATTDDDKIKTWRWDLIQGPINYQPVLTETSTLALANLTLPGNYTFKLTVTDSDNASNSTTANITVLKAIDYPPSANAGEPVIIFLPQSSVTLDGSRSTDDHEITAWEWTKDPSDVSKAVDMQKTREPRLQLSNLEEGIYTFVLKVTDISNQSNTAKVRVFVKRPSNKPPAANAGLDQTITLPQSWAALNATNSTHDAQITSYDWKQVAGPLNSRILEKNAVVANATGLTVGLYTFAVTIVDENRNNATANVSVKVIQETNTPPVAHAGGDQSVTLPTTTVYVNGSQSNDDLGIVKYDWVRDPTSLAMGTIVGHSDHEPVLIMTNMVAGRYVFKLTVADAQGLTSSDTVSIIVHPDPKLMKLVEVTFNLGVLALSQAEVHSIKQKLVLLLGSNLEVIVRDLQIEQKTGNAILIFYVEENTGANEKQALDGPLVQKMLKEKLWSSSSIVGMSATDIRTSICQNECSGHGVCNSQTRACMCETFWMPSLFYFWGNSEANCDWSILYVVIAVFIIFVLILSLCSAMNCFWRTSKPRTRPKTQRYALLESQEHEIPTLNRTTSLSDESDTDSDVLFENKTKPNGILRNGSTKENSRGYTTTRLGRRIKA